MKVLILSLDVVGEGLAFALRCQAAGHAVRLYVNPEANPSLGTGFKGIEKVSNWTASLRWADLVLPTGNHNLMARLQGAKSQGINVFGPSVKSAELEIKRDIGMRFFEAHGIEVPGYKAFKTLADAVAHVKKTEGRYVFKTLGDADDKSLSYCAKSPADMIARIERWQRLGLKLSGACILQEFIEGVEFAVSGWMGRDGFVGKFNENFENKKLLSGDYGPNCGEAGTTVKYVETSKLADAVLRPLEKDLVAMGHTGDIDVNCIVDKQGTAWPLEFTARLGWPAFNIMCQLHKDDPAQWMLDALDGKDSLRVSPKVATGVVVAQPDYPYSERTKAETDGVPIYGVIDENRRYISPQSVKIRPMPNMSGGKLTMEPTWVSAGDYLVVVTGTGRTVRQSIERAYQTVKQLHVPDMIVRDDVSKSLEKKLPELHRLGYANEFAYGS